MAYDMLDGEYAGHDIHSETEDAATRSDTKKFHFNDLLSLTTGLMLAQEGAAALHRLVAFVMETDAAPSHTALHLPTVKACVEAQCPFLAEVKLESLYPIFKYDPSPNNPYLTVWLEMQGMHFGEEHEIMTLRAWKAANGITDTAESYSLTA
jgi:hypothetical protein